MMLNCANNGCKVLHRGPNHLLDLQIMMDFLVHYFKKPIAVK